MIIWAFALKAIMCWIVAGSFYYGDKVEHLPFSTKGCGNNTDLEGNSTLINLLNKVEDNNTLVYTFNETEFETILNLKNKTDVTLQKGFVSNYIK